MKKISLDTLKKVNPSKRGSNKWLLIRVLFIFSIPLSFYILVSLLLGYANSYASLCAWFNNLFNITIMILFLIIFTWYLILEIVEALEDYIQNKFLKNVFIYLLKVFNIFLISVSIVSIFIIRFK